MLYRVETGLHANITDTQGRKTALHLLKALQIPVAAIRQIKVYTVDGLDAAQVNRLVDEGIWHDPILQQASLEPLPFVEPAPHWIVEVGYRPGVTDNEGRTARDTAAMVLGIAVTACASTPRCSTASPARPTACSAVKRWRPWPATCSATP